MGFHLNMENSLLHEENFILKGFISTMKTHLDTLQQDVIPKNMNCNIMYGTKDMEFFRELITLTYKLDVPHLL